MIKIVDDSNLCSWWHWDNNWISKAGGWIWLWSRHWISTLTSCISWEITEVSLCIPMKSIGARVFDGDSIITASVVMIAIAFVREMNWIAWISNLWAASVNSAYWWMAWMWHGWSSDIVIRAWEVNWWGWSDIWQCWVGIRMICHDWAIWISCCSRWCARGCSGSTSCSSLIWISSCSGGSACARGSARIVRARSAWGRATWWGSRSWRWVVYCWWPCGRNWSCTAWTIFLNYIT